MFKDMTEPESEDVKGQGRNWDSNSKSLDDLGVKYFSFPTLTCPICKKGLENLPSPLWSSCRLRGLEIAALLSIKEITRRMAGNCPAVVREMPPLSRPAC